MTHRSRIRILAAALVLAACSSSSTNVSPPPPPPAPPPPPPPPPSQHLYAGLLDQPGSIYVYALPITAASTPTAIVPLNAVTALGVNSTTLAAATLDYTVAFYNLPITSSSVPYATLASGSFGTPLFLPNGTLYHGGTDTINVYTPPFTANSVPSSRIPTPTLTPTSLAIDPSGRVYETTGTVNTIGVVTGGALTTKLTAPFGLAFRSLAASATQLFVCEETGSAPHIYVYALPLTASATPAVIMNVNVSAPKGCALDASGNLYVSTTGQIVMYTPPFTASSARAVTLTLPGTVNGIAIGP